MRSGKLAALIPAYDAEAWLGDVVERTVQQLECVLVVDDGSSDQTSSVAARAGASVVRHPANRGKGHALTTGFRELFDSGYEAVVTLDADGQHLPEQIPRLTRAFDNDPETDLVLGTRSHLFDQMSSLRRMSNTLSSRIISLVAGCPLADVQTGFRIYTRRLVEEVPFWPGRFESESAVVVRAARAGYKVVNVPIELGFVDGRQTSHYRPLLDSLSIARGVARARFTRRQQISQPQALAARDLTRSELAASELSSTKLAGDG